jgi:hypothetical protein
VFWKQLFYAFPATMFGVNLTIYYAIWWALRLSTSGDVTNREIGRHWIFGEIAFGVQEIKYTIIITLVLTVIVIGIARLMDRGDKAEG